MTDEQKQMFLHDILDRVGMEGIGNLILEQNNTIQVGREQAVQMPPLMMQPEAMALYRFLLENEFIDATTTSENFLYLMGVSATDPPRLRPINWLTTQQQLRTLLQLCYKGALERGSLRMAELERRVPSCFLVKGHRLTSLAKATTEYSLGMDLLHQFFEAKRE